MEIVYIWKCVTSLIIEEGYRDTVFHLLVTHIIADQLQNKKYRVINLRIPFEGFSYILYFKWFITFNMAWRELNWRKNFITNQSTFKFPWETCLHWQVDFTVCLENIKLNLGGQVNNHTRIYTCILGTSCIWSVTTHMAFDSHSKFNPHSKMAT